MYEFLEPRVRALIAEQLGAGFEELVSDVRRVHAGCRGESVWPGEAARRSRAQHGCSVPTFHDGLARRSRGLTLNVVDAGPGLSRSCSGHARLRRRAGCGTDGMRG